MRVPKVLSSDEKEDIEELISHAISHPIQAEDITTLKESRPHVLQELIDAHTIQILGMNVCVLFEVHEGHLFQRIRLQSEQETQPRYDTCMDLLPHLGISRNQRDWAASWVEVEQAVPGSDEQPRMVYNISQIVVPPTATLQ